ncbi:hypothetical protein D3C81_1871740 [compost metagenome]
MRDQPGQTPGACRIVPVQQGVFGEQVAAHFQHIVEVQLLEAPHVVARGRAGLVQIEHDVVQEKQHGPSTATQALLAR